MASDKSGTLAVLIDGDNASPKHIAGLMAEIANYGTASVKRVYGDWTEPNLKGWKRCLLEYSIQPIQVSPSVGLCSSGVGCRAASGCQMVPVELGHCTVADRCDSNLLIPRARTRQTVLL